MVSCPLIDDVGLQFLENGAPSLQVLTLPSHTKAFDQFINRMFYKV